MISVLDAGYVRIRKYMGDDLDIVNAARVSYDKAANWEPDGYDHPVTGEWVYEGKRLGSRDERLLRFLLENGHTSPLRHSVLTYEVYAPLMVMRQWGKYRVGSVWSFEDSDDPIETVNESSRRYITEEPVFYIPDVWRSAPENSKQGSGGPVESWCNDDRRGEVEGLFDDLLYEYNYALSKGICAEQARLFLPAYALYVRSWWTVSLQGVIHFIQQRVAHDAQWEIAEYARAVRDLTAPLFPKTFELLGLAGNEATTTDVASAAASGV